MGQILRGNATTTEAVRRAIQHGQKSLRALAARYGINQKTVANMEDVLEVYRRPHDPQRPFVCLDETSKQMNIETRAPIPDKQTLTSEVAAWQENRDKHYAKADWQFTTADARVKLKRLYPRFQWLGALGAMHHAIPAARQRSRCTRIINQTVGP